jgi:alpha-1,3-rhamnosyl/mannosyltransferase
LRLIEDDALSAAARAASGSFGQRFSWTACVERTISLYREIA